MFKSLLKFIKDSNVESVLGFLTLILLRIGCQHNFDNCSWYPNLATCKNWEFLEQGKGSIFNIQGWVGFNNSEKYKTMWAPLVSLTVRTTVPPVPTAFEPWPLPLCHPRLRCRHRTAHSLTAAPLLSSPSIKGAHPPGEQPFSSSAPSPPLCYRAAIIETPWNAALVPLWTSHHRPELGTDSGSSLDLLVGALGCSSVALFCLRLKGWDGLGLSDPDGPDTVEEA
jgi:hypothetical protein